MNPVTLTANLTLTISSTTPTHRGGIACPSLASLQRTSQGNNGSASIKKSHTTMTTPVQDQSLAQKTIICRQLHSYKPTLTSQIKAYLTSSTVAQALPHSPAPRPQPSPRPPLPPVGCASCSPGLLPPSHTVCAPAMAGSAEQETVNCFADHVHQPSGGLPPQAVSLFSCPLLSAPPAGPACCCFQSVRGACS